MFLEDQKRGGQRERERKGDRERGGTERERERVDSKLYTQFSSKFAKVNKMFLLVL